MFGFGKKKKQKKKEEELQRELAKADETLQKEEGKKKETPQDPKEKSKKSRTDKLVMGAIMGVAVGSVVGMSLKAKNEHEQKEEPSFLAPAKEKVQEPAEPRSRLFRFFKKLFSKFSGKKKPKQKKEKTFFKKIPNEWE